VQQLQNHLFNKSFKQDITQHYIANVKQEIEPYLCEEHHVLGKIETQILCLRMIAEKYREVHKIVCNCFVDFKKVFDLVWHEGLWAVLRLYGVNNKLVTILYKYWAWR